MGTKETATIAICQIARKYFRVMEHHMGFRDGNERAKLQISNMKKPGTRPGFRYKTESADAVLVGEARDERALCTSGPRPAQAANGLPYLVTASVKRLLI